MMSGDVTGPRWVGGVNAPAPGGGDYEALVREGRRGGQLARDLADAVEALTADKRDLLRIAQEANDDCKALIAECAALRAQLDGMTVEWASTYSADDESDTPVYSAADEADARKYTQGRNAVVVPFGFRTVKRLVSPWTAVEDAEVVSDGQQ